MLKQESHAPFYSSIHGVSHYPVIWNNLLLGSTEELPKMVVSWVRCQSLRSTLHIPTAYLLYYIPLNSG